MPSVKKNFLYSSILTTANYVFPLITYPYVSRVLGVTNIGICNFVDSIIHYFVLVSMMGINIVGIREVAKDKRSREELNGTFSALFWLNTITTTVAFVVLVVATLCVDQLREHWQMMAIGGIKLLMNYMLIEWLYKGLEEFKYITVRTLAVKMMYVVAVFIFVRRSSDYPVYYLLSVLMVVFNSVVNVTYARHFVSLQIRHVHISRFIKPFFVLGVYYLLTAMYTSVNVAYLGFVAGETEVGYYTTATKLYHILIALFTAFTGVMLPRMSSLIAENKIQEYKTMLVKAYNILFAFSIPLIIYTIIYAPLIIYIIAGKGYDGAIMPMRIVMPLMLIIGYEQIIIVQALMPLKKDNAIFRNSVIGAITGVVLNLLLVSSLKSVGSSIVWLISEIVVLCSAQYYVWKYLRIQFPWKSFMKNSLVNIPLVGMLVLVYATVNNMLYSVISSVVALMTYFYITQKYILRNQEVCSYIDKIKCEYCYKS